MNFLNRKKIAWFFLAVTSTNLFVPITASALTSGPSQPETKAFQPAGVSDMVDLQSGSLKYNLPLIDIDGYPLNLAYQSGSGLEDEASWVGLGWTLNPGAVNRQVRGLPDDFAGDETEVDHYTKPKVTAGGRITAKVESRGKAKLGATFSFGIFSDNYTGIGAELGVNAGISYSLGNSGMLTGGLGLGVMSNTQSGVDASVSPYVSLAVKTQADDNVTAHAGISGSLGYNSRSGMKSLALGTSYGLDQASYQLTGSTLSYNTEPVSPAVQIPYKTSYGSFSLDVGGTAWVLFGGAGGTGYQNVRQIKSFVNKKPSYGYLYAERGKNNPNAVMDFIREKENPVVPNLPNLAIPVHLPDMWSYTSQTGGGQFRLYRGGSGAFFDSQATDESSMDTWGADFGFGAYFHGGVTKFDQETKNVTRKWIGENDFLAKGDFQDWDTKNANNQHVYFRKVGETGSMDAGFSSQVKDVQAVGVNVNGTRAEAYFRTATGTSAVPELKNKSRRMNSTAISYLTAFEATQGGLDKEIRNYTPASPTGTLPASPGYTKLSRVDGSHKIMHISEMDVTDESGKRMVYGIPTYNTRQEEYTFAVGTGNTPAVKTNRVDMPSSMINSPQTNVVGTDSYYHKEIKAPYATGYLLTAVLSPDYVDKTGNGVTDDDMGTAIQFHYSKLGYNYRWRTPYSSSTLNKSQLADPQDDKGSIVYGEKELWYISSIESKTKIAYFITEDRRDALGVLNWNAGGKDPANMQKRLQEVRLYSKADMTRPIKVVKFEYNYELCKGTTGFFLPNSADAGSTDPALGGKLTLKKVWFEYGNTDKGANHQYQFTYNNTTVNSSNATITPYYSDMLTDRWGTYKDPLENTNGLDNSFYPYTNQNKAVTDKNASLWQLSSISLPTGGTIAIDYEAGDYAYVQDKKAMVMQPVIDINAVSQGQEKNLYTTDGFSIDVNTTLPAGADPTSWFKTNFLNGESTIYTKFKVKMSTPNNESETGVQYDYIPCYAQVQSVSMAGTVATVRLVKNRVSGVEANPICMAAWQRLKNEYPRFAYPGYSNRVRSGNGGFVAAAKAVISAAGNLGELRTNFYERARDKGYAKLVDPAKSFVRITKWNGKKLGGGARVKKISITDNWQKGGGSATYGQTYAYTTMSNGQEISSGVATYEPSVGNDENALKQPIFYDENIKGALSNYFTMELPFCESLYPGPSVGYSKVTVTDIGPDKGTGYIVNEFYTAKDYPVKVKYLPIQRSPTVNTNSYSLVRTNSVNKQCLSQGYVIELNDMHGKAKATRVFNQSGAEISSSVFYYNSKNNLDAGSLDNNVSVIDPLNLALSTKVLGRDIEFYTDFREQETTNFGTAINIGADVFPIFFFPFFVLPHNPKAENNDYKLFRSVSALKVVQNYGILNRVVKTQNGSSITTQNVAFDGLTGEPVITRTQNEFNKDIFSVNIPAYWAYKGMGGAYQNQGVLLTDFTTNANGEIQNYSAYLQAGDELISVNEGVHYWVVDNTAFSGGGTTKKLIDAYGKMKKALTPKMVKVVRSGYRNMLNDKITTLVCLNNPISATGFLQLNTTADLTALKVINSSATTYDENWAASSIQYRGATLGKIENKLYNWTMQAPTTVIADNKFACVSTKPFLVGSSIVPADYICNIAGTFFNGQGRLGASAVYPQDDFFDSGQLYKITVTFTVPRTDTYYLGHDGLQGFIFDCFDDHGHFTKADNSWLVQPWPLTAGSHVVTMMLAKGVPAGLEIYDNNQDQIVNAGSGSGIKVLFSTSQLRGKIPIQTTTSVNTSAGLRPVYHYTYSNDQPIDVCAPAEELDAVVNPYTIGYLGNWRPYQTKVNQTSRNYGFSGNLDKAGVNVKDAGYLDNFRSYWVTNNTVWSANVSATKWVNANTVTLYDLYGQQLENKDALNRYSAAKFDFNGELPAAVASNAKNRDIYYGGFEDSKFTWGKVNVQQADIRDFRNSSTSVLAKETALNTLSHSGNYSVLMPVPGLALSTIVHSKEHKSEAYLEIDAEKQYKTRDSVNIYPNGFQPTGGKQYIFNAWIKDTHPQDKTLSMTLLSNNVNVPLTCKAVVEGWKLVEGVIDLTSITTGALNIKIAPNSGETIYIDDIRIHPFDAHMKSYAYDEKTLRLMAELDENAFATFYEYDDEGLLIRVKKETERGVMTIKETRSSYKKGAL